MRRYTSALTRELTPDNWQDKINLQDMTLDQVTDLLADFKHMETFGKKVGGFLKEAAKAKLPEGETEFVGHNYQFVLNERVRAGSLNKEMILEEMGLEWVGKHSNPSTEYVELRLTPVEAA